MIHLSQSIGDYSTKNFPGTNVPYKLYGCLVTCLCMLLEKNPNDFMAENPDGWTKDGNLKTDAVLAKYGYKLIRQAIQEGTPLPKKDVRYIARTSFYRNIGYETHFYLVNPDGTFSDPASKSPHKANDKYAGRINEIRFLEKVAPDINVPSKLSVEDRLKRLEQKLGIV